MAEKHSKSKRGPSIGRIIRDFDKSKAPLTRGEMALLEERFTAQDKAILRRLGLAFLAQSGSELTRAIVGADQETAREMVSAASHLKDYADRLVEFAQFMRCASTRMAMASTKRPDFDDLTKKAFQAPRARSRPQSLSHTAHE